MLTETVMSQRKELLNARSQGRSGLAFHCNVIGGQIRVIKVAGKSTFRKTSIESG